MFLTGDTSLSSHSFSLISAIANIAINHTLRCPKKLNYWGYIFVADQFDAVGFKISHL